MCKIICLTWYPVRCTVYSVQYIVYTSVRRTLYGVPYSKRTIYYTKFTVPGISVHTAHWSRPMATCWCIRKRTGVRCAVRDITSLSPAPRLQRQLLVIGHSSYIHIVLLNNRTTRIPSVYIGYSATNVVCPWRTIYRISSDEMFTFFWDIGYS